MEKLSMIPIYKSYVKKLFTFLSQLGIRYADV